MNIQRNRHPAGRINNMLFGLNQIVDGAIRVLSLGFFHSTATLDHARKTARKPINHNNR